MSNQSPEFRKLLDYINATPELLSLLYDLDLMPEQLDFPSHDGNRMILIAAWHRVKFENHAAKNDLTHQDKLE